MTDKEAYELLVKYSGGEKSMIMIREMIHVAGYKKAAKNMIRSFCASGKNPPPDFRNWIIQSFKYIENAGTNN